MELGPAILKEEGFVHSLRGSAWMAQHKNLPEPIFRVLTEHNELASL